ncbi:MAG: response regulator [Phycisphaeraceae bacterium]|nr:response regulator [Phycisphaeraceae bacterium]
MSIKTKIILVLLIAIIVSSGVQFRIEQLTIMPSFNALQHTEAMKDIDRCIRALKNQVDPLSTMAKDWSAWDGTYAFVGDRDAAFLESTLPPDSFVSGNINLLYIFDENGQLVWGQAHDSNTGESIDIHEFNQPTFLEQYGLLKHDSTDSSIDGILLTETGPLLTSSKPITTSEHTGSIRGTLVMGQLLNQATVDHLSQDLSVPFSIEILGAAPRSMEDERALQQLTQRGSPMIADGSRGLLDAYGIIYDLKGEPALLVKAQVPKSIAAKGRAAIFFASWSILFVSAITLIVTYFILDKMVLSRLLRVSRKMDDIVRSEDLSTQADVVSSDELGRLEVHLNRMLGHLASTKQKTIAAKERAELLAQEAQAANRAKSSFLANMSHEIRTPMNSILCFSDMLTQEDLTQEQKNYVDTIRESGRNLLTLINDILDYSKIEASQLNVEMIDCSLGHLLNSLETTMTALTQGKSVDFEIMAEKDLPAQIHSDPFRLNQCLTNLLSNAVKFTDQGHVHLKVSLREDNNQHSIQFDVEDTGTGIPKDRQKAIFESFNQADGSTTRKYGGTGLGLAITGQLAELLDGTVTLTSEPGEGSVFSLVIPIGMDITEQSLLDRHKVLDQDADESWPTGVSPFSGNILVAEDVEGNQRLMKIMLSKLGVDVVLAGDGIQAVQAASSQTFDLIFMDMQMPHMNGYEATSVLKQQGCKSPIVALTANAMKGDDQVCLDAGCDGYLAKPIDRRELARTLAKYLPTRKSVSTQTVGSEVA